MRITKPKTEFAAALQQICAERNLEVEVVLETISEAMLAAYKRDYGLEEGFDYEAKVDPDTGETHLYQWPKDKPEEKKEITPAGFGRIAAQVAKQVLLQKIREAEKNAILEEYSQKIGGLTSGMIIRFEGPNVIVDVGRLEALMPPEEQVREEKYTFNQKLTFLIKGVEETPKGRKLIVSRADPQIVEALFRREVREVATGAVKIVKIARDAGSRTKVAVMSTQAGVDPVGSCVGQKGVRVQVVIDELGGEKIDIIQFSEDPVKFISAALSPVEKVSRVEINEKEKKAIVWVPEDQLSLAIGKNGQNVNLASQLTGYKIDIKSEKEKSNKREEEKN
ncbi:MAG: transcription termination factor NusA [Microgenomates group bacterium]